MSEIVDYDGVLITDGETAPEDAPEGATVVPPLMFEEARRRAGSATSKAWVRYEGPRGGEGWQNPATREVRYQRDKPGSDAEGEQTQRTLPGAQFEIPNKYKPSEVWTEPGLIAQAIEDITGHSFDVGTWDSYDEGREFDVPTVEGMPDIEERQDILFWFYEWAEKYGDASDVSEFHDRLNTGKTPYADVTDEDVPDPKFNPNNYDEFKPIREVANEESDVVEGVSSSSMYIAESENGDRLFVKNLDRDVKSAADERHAINAQNAARLFNHIFGYEANAPDTHLVEGRYLATEEYDGKPIHHVYSDVRRYPAMYAKHMAANFVVGNFDAHQFNVFTGADGFATVDLDQSFQHIAHSPQNLHVQTLSDAFFAFMEEAAETLDDFKGPEAATRFHLEATEEYVKAIERNAEAVAEFLRSGEVETGDDGVFSADELTAEQREKLETVIESVESGFVREKVYEAAKPWDRYVENVLGVKDPDFDPQPLLDEYEARAEGRP